MARSNECLSMSESRALRLSRSDFAPSKENGSAYVLYLWSKSIIKEYLERSHKMSERSAAQNRRLACAWIALDLSVEAIDGFELSFEIVFIEIELSRALERHRSIAWKASLPSPDGHLEEGEATRLGEPSRDASCSVMVGMAVEAPGGDQKIIRADALFKCIIKRPFGSSERAVGEREATTLE